MEACGKLTAGTAAQRQQQHSQEPPNVTHWLLEEMLYLFDAYSWKVAMSARAWCADRKRKLSVDRSGVGIEAP